MGVIPQAYLASGLVPTQHTGPRGATQTAWDTFFLLTCSMTEAQHFIGTLGRSWAL